MPKQSVAPAKQTVLEDKLQELGVKVGEQAEPVVKAVEHKPIHANGSDNKMSSESSNHDKSFWFQIALGIAVVVMVFMYIKTVAEKPVTQTTAKPAASHQAPAKVSKKAEAAPAAEKRPKAPAAAVVKVDTPVPVVEEKAAPKVAETAVAKTEPKVDASEGGSIWLSKLGLDEKKAEAPTAAKVEEQKPAVELSKSQAQPAAPAPVSVAKQSAPAQEAPAPMAAAPHGMMPPAPPHAMAPGREEAPAWAQEHMSRIEQLRKDLNVSMQQLRDEGRMRMDEERKRRDDQRKQDVPDWMRAHMERAEQLRNEYRKAMEEMQSAMREHRGEHMPQQQPDYTPGYPQGPAYYGPNSGGYGYPAYRK